MPLTFSDDVIGNYEQLRAERGWSYETLADHIETTDRRLAAHFRRLGRDGADPGIDEDGPLDITPQTAEQLVELLDANERDNLRAALDAAGQPDGVGGTVAAAENPIADTSSVVDASGAAVDGGDDNTVSAARQQPAATSFMDSGDTDADSSDDEEGDVADQKPDQSQDRAKAAESRKEGTSKRTTAPKGRRSSSPTSTT